MILSNITDTWRYLSFDGDVTPIWCAQALKLKVHKKIVTHWPKKVAVVKGYFKNRYFKSTLRLLFNYEDLN